MGESARSEGELGKFGKKLDQIRQISGSLPGLACGSGANSQGSLRWGGDGGSVIGSTEALGADPLAGGNLYGCGDLADDITDAAGDEFSQLDFTLSAQKSAVVRGHRFEIRRVFWAE